MQTAYSYLRFSTPEQMGGDSIRRQSTAARDWCLENNVHLDTTLSFNDFGRSGFTGANFDEGALGLFFSLVKDGTIRSGSFLVLESLDRFSRENPLKAASRLFDLVMAGITIVTVDDNKTYSVETLSGRDSSVMLLLVIKMSQNHLESLRKSDRVGKAWQEKKSLARSEGKPLTSRCPEWLEIVNGSFQPIEKRVAVIRRIFQDTINGFGRREIVRRLNADHISPFRSKDGTQGWQTSTIAKIVQGRMVLGEYQPHRGTHRQGNRTPDGEPVTNYYPAIIDEETFYLAQGAISERRKQTAGRRGTNGAHLLRGLAKCSECGGPMHILNKGKPPKGGVYLACSANRRNAGCDNAVKWRVDKLEEAVLLCLTSVKTKSFEEFDNEVVERGRNARAIRAHLEDLDSRIKISMELAETGNEQAIARFHELAQEIKNKKKELKSAESLINMQKNDPGDATRLDDIFYLSKSFFELEGEERVNTRTRLSSLIRRLVDRIECDSVRGAHMILKSDSKFLRILNPKNGDFAYQVRITMSPSGKSSAHPMFLLVRNPTDEQRDAFFRGLGGWVIKSEGETTFIRGTSAGVEFKT
ncbi:MAG: recombinase family protein [Hoeflea sp.]|nr:recombinase family protein [Hoeflea sp.]